MSKPQERLSLTRPLGTVLGEMASAMSALNMEPETLTGGEIEGESGFLSETDKWVKHAMEHLVAALRLLQEYEDNLN